MNNKQVEPKIEKQRDWSQPDKKSRIHKWELRLLKTGLVFVIIEILTLLIFSQEIYDIIEEIAGVGEAQDIIATSAELTSLYQNTFYLLLGLPLVCWIGRAFYYAKQRLQAVRITPTQFPDAYKILVEAAESAGLDVIPDAYVISGNGTLNAFAAGHGYRRYVCVYSDLFEIGGPARDRDALRFIIGHEVGHIAAGHTGFFRTLLLSYIGILFPILLPQGLSRAQEYTADNFGYAYCPEGSKGGMAVLAGGKYLNSAINVTELADRSVIEKGFWAFLTNMPLSHPPITWRSHAICDRSKPGKLLFRPKTFIQGNPTIVAGRKPKMYWPTVEEAKQSIQDVPSHPDEYGQVFAHIPSTENKSREYSERVYGQPPQSDESNT